MVCRSTPRAYVYQRLVPISFNCFLQRRLPEPSVSYPALIQHLQCCESNSGCPPAFAAIGLGAVTLADSVFCQSDARGDVPAVKVASSCAKNRDAAHLDQWLGGTAPGPSFVLPSHHIRPACEGRFRGALRQRGLPSGSASPFAVAAESVADIRRCRTLSFASSSSKVTTTTSLVACRNSSNERT
jgi:hypothetical protein